MTSEFGSQVLAPYFGPIIKRVEHLRSDGTKTYALHVQNTIKALTIFGPSSYTDGYQYGIRYPVVIRDNDKISRFQDKLIAAFNDARGFRRRPVSFQDRLRTVGYYDKYQDLTFDSVAEPYYEDVEVHEVRHHHNRYDNVIPTRTDFDYQRFLNPDIINGIIIAKQMRGLKKVEFERSTAEETSAFLAELALGPVPPAILGELFDRAEVALRRIRDEGIVDASISEYDAAAIGILSDFLWFLQAEGIGNYQWKSITEMSEAEFHAFGTSVANRFEGKQLTDNHLAKFAEDTFQMRFHASLYVGNYQARKGNRKLTITRLYNLMQWSHRWTGDNYRTTDDYSSSFFGAASVEFLFKLVVLCVAALIFAAFAPPVSVADFLSLYTKSMTIAAVIFYLSHVVEDVVAFVRSGKSLADVSIRDVFLKNVFPRIGATVVFLLSFAGFLYGYNYLATLYFASSSWGQTGMLILGFIGAAAAVLVEHQGYNLLAEKLGLRKLAPEPVRVEVKNLPAGAINGFGDDGYWMVLGKMQALMRKGKDGAGYIFKAGNLWIWSPSKISTVRGHPNPIMVELKDLIDHLPDSERATIAAVNIVMKETDKDSTRVNTRNLAPAVRLLIEKRFSGDLLESAMSYFQQRNRFIDNQAAYRERRTFLSLELKGDTIGSFKKSLQRLSSCDDILQLSLQERRKQIPLEEKYAGATGWQLLIDDNLDAKRLILSILNSSYRPFQVKSEAVVKKQQLTPADMAQWDELVADDGVAYARYVSFRAKYKAQGVYRLPDFEPDQDAPFLEVFLRSIVEVVNGNFAERASDPKNLSTAVDLICRQIRQVREQQGVAENMASIMQSIAVPSPAADQTVGLGRIAEMEDKDEARKVVYRAISDRNGHSSVNATMSEDASGNVNFSLSSNQDFTEQYKNVVALTGWALNLLFNAHPTARENALAEAKRLTIEAADGYQKFSPYDGDTVLGLNSSPLPQEVRKFFLQHFKDHPKEFLDFYVNSDLVEDVIRALGGKNGLDKRGLLLAFGEFWTTLYTYYDKDGVAFNKALSLLVSRSYRFSKAVDKNLGRQIVLLRGRGYMLTEENVIPSADIESATVLGPKDGVNSIDEFEERIAQEDHDKFFVYHQVWKETKPNGDDRYTLLLGRRGQTDLLYSSITYSKVSGFLRFQKHEGVYGVIDAISRRFRHKWFSKPKTEHAHSLSAASSLTLARLVENAGASGITIVPVKDTDSTVDDLYVTLGLAIAVRPDQDGKSPSEYVSRDAHGDVVYGNQLNLSPDSARHDSWSQTNSDALKSNLHLLPQADKRKVLGLTERRPSPEEIDGIKRRIFKMAGNGSGVPKKLTITFLYERMEGLKQKFSWLGAPQTTDDYSNSFFGAASVEFLFKLVVLCVAALIFAAFAPPVSVSDFLSLYTKSMAIAAGIFYLSHVVEDVVAFVRSGKSLADVSIRNVLLKNVLPRIFGTATFLLSFVGFLYGSNYLATLYFASSPWGQTIVLGIGFLGAAAAVLGEHWGYNLLADKWGLRNLGPMPEGQNGGNGRFNPTERNKWRVDEFQVADQSFPPKLGNAVAVRRINLTRLPVGTLIHYEIAGGHWNYTLRIETGQRVSIWLRGDRGRMVGPSESVGTFDLLIDRNESGILAENSIAFMPYFHQDVGEQGRILQKVGTEGFNDRPEKIYVELPPNETAPKGAMEMAPERTIDPVPQAESNFQHSIRWLAYLFVFAKDTRAFPELLAMAREKLFSDGRNFGISEGDVQSILDGMTMADSKWLESFFWSRFGSERNKTDFPYTLFLLELWSHRFLYSISIAFPVDLSKLTIQTLLLNWNAARQADMQLAALQLVRLARITSAENESQLIEFLASDEVRVSDMGRAHGTDKFKTLIQNLKRFKDNPDFAAIVKNEFARAPNFDRTKANPELLLAVLAAFGSEREDSQRIAAQLDAKPEKAFIISKAFHDQFGNDSNRRDGFVMAALLRARVFEGKEMPLLVDQGLKPYYTEFIKRNRLEGKFSVEMPDGLLTGAQGNKIDPHVLAKAIDLKNRNTTLITPEGVTILDDSALAEQIAELRNNSLTFEQLVPIEDLQIRDLVTKLRVMLVAA